MKSTIGMVELPQLGLFDPEGKNLLSEDTRGDVLISKHQEEYGKATWRETELSKVYYGRKIDDLDPLDYDVWGITNNFSQYREVACMTIKHLANKGRPVVIGGSDVIAEPQANAPIMDHVLGRTPREELSGVILAEGTQPSLRAKKVLSPQDWPLPDISIVKQCLGTKYKDLPLPKM